MFSRLNYTSSEAFELEFSVSCLLFGWIASEIIAIDRWRRHYNFYLLVRRLRQIARHGVRGSSYVGCQRERKLIRDCWHCFNHSSTHQQSFRAYACPWWTNRDSGPWTRPMLDPSWECAALDHRNSSSEPLSLALIRFGRWQSPGCWWGLLWISANRAKTESTCTRATDESANPMRGKITQS